MNKLTVSQFIIAAIIASSSQITHAQVLAVAPGEGGSNVGGTEDNITVYSVNPWNTGIVRTIKHTRQSATDNFADNKIETAIKIYELQLEKISLTASDPALQLSWTKKIADRTLDLAGRLNTSITNKDERIAIYNVYASAYRLIEDTYTKLDLGYIIPYYREGKKHKIDLNSYEYELNQYILNQAKWFNDRFVAGSNEYGTLPKYSPKTFLIAMSTLTKGLAADLLTDAVTGPNLFPHKYESTVDLLKGISEDIDNHLAGGTVFSGKDDRAINNSYRSFKEALSNIQ